MIQGEKREEVVYVEQRKYVGFFQGKVVGINPTPQEFEKIHGYTPKEDSKLFNYLGEKDGVPFLRIDFWIQDLVKRTDVQGNPHYPIFKLTFFLRDELRVSKDGVKNQYINNIGDTSWASSEDELVDWFKDREPRQAHEGEEEFYYYLRRWISNINWKSEDSRLMLNWKKLMKGDVDELKGLIDSEYVDNLFYLATIATYEDSDGIPTARQNVYNRRFLFNTKIFNVKDYDIPENSARLRARAQTKAKMDFSEDFVVKVTDPEYGCKDFFKLKPLKEYDPRENEANSGKVKIESDSSEY